MIVSARALSYALPTEGFDTCLGETLGVAEADVLRAAVGMADETAASKGAAFVQGLLQGIEDEVRPRRSRHAPAHDPTKTSTAKAA
ncbi:hypothetical protein ASF26_16610 [Methylobacterium sp. Leaf93]|nr:hypothetical protein ASF26_16610 [Methylobacterium sp. Leaf93]